MIEKLKRFQRIEIDGITTPSKLIESKIVPENLLDCCYHVRYNFKKHSYYKECCKCYSEVNLKTSQYPSNALLQSDKRQCQDLKRK